MTELIPTKKLEDLWAAMQVASSIERIEYQRATLRCDQEPAMVALVRRVKIACYAEVVVETALRGDKDANGLGERAVQSAEARIINMKSDLEERICNTIPMTAPFMGWMARHAVFRLNVWHVRKSGQTPYECLHGRPYRGDIIEREQCEDTRG